MTDPAEDSADGAFANRAVVTNPAALFDVATRSDALRANDGKTGAIVPEHRLNLGCNTGTRACGLSWRNSSVRCAPPFRSTGTSSMPVMPFSAMNICTRRGLGARGAMNSFMQVSWVFVMGACQYQSIAAGFLAAGCAYC